jgi:hypothetical protein
MRLTLTRRGRGLLLFLSASGYTAWFSGIGGRSDAAGDALPYSSAISTPHFEAERPVTAQILRDPFAGAPTHGPDAAPSDPRAGSSGERAPAPAPQAVAASPGDLDVPNIGDAGGAEAPVALAVRATIVGTNPVAYVENGTAMDIVRIGDTLGEERVVNIDLRGLTFADGTRLDLPDSFNATPPPAPIALSLADRIAELRKLIVHLKAQPASAQPVPAASAQPSSLAASPAYPSPAPLETVDPHGIPAGTNPTPDANGPTPYPYPFPYAPRR